MSYTTRPDGKRRKIRKGTHSCWACKRRKMKCIFDSNDDLVCQGCRHKKSACVSQEFPENGSGLQEVRQVSNDGAPLSSCSDMKSDAGLPTPASHDFATSLTASSNNKSGPLDDDIHLSASESSAIRDKNKRLSKLLHESLPSVQDMTSIFKASLYSSVLALASLVVPYSVIEEEAEDIIETTLIVPNPNEQPVLLARHMLRLAACLHHLHPSIHAEISTLSEPPRAMMQRLADTAISLITTNDDLLGSIEGLQCVMIESVYQMNKGSLRRSWVACRRAMTIAQLMELHRPNSQGRYKVLDQRTRFSPHHIWFRIVSLERHLCLMLGLPQGSNDHSMATEDLLAHETPMGRLERLHCVLASQILERNETLPGTNDAGLTQDLDKELQKVARSLPSKWWLTPNLKGDPNNRQALFWNIRQLFAHMFHYSLLIQLHLPYMLGSSPSEQVCHYSRITCVNASREVILRFITLRNFDDIGCDCRTIEFLALMAAMALLIAHLEGQCLESGNLLAHQYITDRALIEQVQDHMAKLHKLNGDPLSAQSAILLERLLMIDGEDSLSKDEQIVPSLRDQDDDIAISPQTPYSTIIRIAREGIIKPAPRLEDTPASTAFTSESLDATTAAVGCSSTYDTSELSSFNFALQQGDFPSLTAGLDDWAFQGVDTAFFDSLLRSTNLGENGLNNAGTFGSNMNSTQ
ncbi:hypothetical protein HBH56_221750 [Parastagonospora nodorum]|nr:hypothetical protein HBH56_221750 [Parastagonospora nodorum]KAH3924167.1 hypothetical protein HBH54_200000 [Parastagonospora nodorum]KAH3944463.1 hypothetical protein HBH53_156370 [Parastagonospora nodorum]KAH3963343.1 hypothetical protein HBH51_168340 [Parastagonospora nodorum]KAH3964825.1 hypothetical protein HBH52_209360 [Parastagonospora nodorum]